MEIRLSTRYTIAFAVMFILFVLIWFILPDPVFSQDERPAFSRSECPADDSGYIEDDNLGHRGGPGFLECRYEKEQEGYPNPQNKKSLYITYYENSEIALEKISEDWLNDEYLKKFSCGDDCVEGQSVLVERTDNSFYGYYVPYPDSEPDSYVLERGYIDGNYHVQVFARGELEEAKSELAELTVSAKELVAAPREMVPPGTSTGDCGCDDPTEEPGVESGTSPEEEAQEAVANVEEETAEEESQDKSDNSEIAELAELITLFGTDPEKLSEWPGWENLTDTQRTNLIKIIDRLDDVLNAESPEAVIELDAVEETTDPDKVILQSAEILKNELWVISTILNQYQYFNYFGDGPAITTETVGEIDKQLTNKIDPIVDMFIPITPTDFEYTLVTFASLAGEGKNLTPEKIAGVALENLLGNDKKNVLRVLDLYSIYREEYDRAQSGSDNLTADEIHQAAITKIKSSGYSLDASTLMTLFSLRQKNVPAPNIPGLEERR